MPPIQGDHEHARRWIGALALAVTLLAGTPALIAQGVPAPSEPPLPSVPYRLELPLPEVEQQPSAEILPRRPDTQPAANSNARGMTLGEVERLTLARHPLVREAMADVDAARGNWLQVGLKPNPTIGYMASEVGDEGQAGQQGVYVGQTFVRGDKLPLNRAVAEREVVMQQQAVVLAQQQVLTDARMAFYDLLVLQSRGEILEKLAELTRQAETTAKQLFDARESPKTDYLQASVERQHILLDLQTTRVAQRRAQEVLATRMALDRLAGDSVDGDLEDLASTLDWQAILDQISATHPAVLMAQADVQRARRAIARQQAQVVPDLVTQAAVQYADATRYTVVSVQAGMAVPLWNRNQGGVAAAWAELRAADQRVAQVQLDLRRQLAEFFADYIAAQQRVATYRQQILPQAAETQKLIAQAYRQGEVGFLNYLTAQRTFFEANLGYLDALKAYWLSRTRIQGLLPPT